MYTIITFTQQGRDELFSSLSANGFDLSLFSKVSDIGISVDGDEKLAEQLRSKFPSLIRSIGVSQSSASRIYTDHGDPFPSTAGDSSSNHHFSFDKSSTDLSMRMAKVVYDDNAPRGKNVDIVIVDLNEVMPNFLVFGESDSAGNPTKLEVASYNNHRVNEVNWYDYKPEGSVFVSNTNSNITDQDNYEYSRNSTSHKQPHASQVASLAAGHFCGFATQANVYSINVYKTQDALGFRYSKIIKQWHDAKPINPDTGVKNPTVVCCAIAQNAAGSYGINAQFGGSERSDNPYTSTGLIGNLVNINGVSTSIDPDVNADFIEALRDNKVRTKINETSSTAENISYATLYNSSYLTVKGTEATLLGTNYYGGLSHATCQSDLAELTATSGVFFVKSAPNDSRYIAPSGTNEYDNHMYIYTDSTKTNSVKFWTNRPDDPHNNDVIYVGGISTAFNNAISSASAIGPAVNYYAPSDEARVYTPFINEQLNDPIRTADLFTTVNGTSNSAGHAAGIIACYLSDGNHDASLSDLNSWLASSGSWTEFNDEYSNPVRKIKYPWAGAASPRVANTLIRDFFATWPIIDLTSTGRLTHEQTHEDVQAAYKPSNVFINANVSQRTEIHSSHIDWWTGDGVYLLSPGQLGLNEENLNKSIVFKTGNELTRIHDAETDAGPVVGSMSANFCMEDSDTAEGRFAVMLDYLDDSNYVAAELTFASGVYTPIEFAIVHNVAGVRIVLADQNDQNEHNQPNNPQYYNNTFRKNKWKGTVNPYQPMIGNIKFSVRDFQGSRIYTATYTGNGVKYSYPYPLEQLTISYTFNHAGNNLTSIPTGYLCGFYAGGDTNPSTSLGRGIYTTVRNVKIQNF